MGFENKNSKTYTYVTRNITDNKRHITCDNIVLKNVNGYSEYECLHCDLDLNRKGIYEGSPKSDSELKEILQLAKDLLLLDD